MAASVLYKLGRILQRSKVRIDSPSMGLFLSRLTLTLVSILKSSGFEVSICLSKIGVTRPY